MRQVTAIILLTIHLFNIAGYRMAFSIGESKASNEMMALLDDNKYNENDLIQVKVALNAPYIQGNGNYERYDGIIEYNGVQYNYVKRMIQNDTLYLYCIPNKEKTDISNIKRLYAKQNADDTSGKTSEQTALKKINFLIEYNFGALNFDLNLYQSLSFKSISFNNLSTLKGFTTEHLQPPDLFI